MSLVRRPKLSEEEGATAVVIASTLLLLMGFAALAVDVSAGKNERRLDQNGADAAALSGAVELAIGGTYQDAVDEVLAHVDTNVRNITAADWTACTDASPLATGTAASLGLTPATTCISFFKTEEIRVKIPPQDTETTFGRVLGAANLTTSAVAQASGLGFSNEGSGPPLIALNGVSGGDEICLRTDSGGPALPPQMTGNGPLLPPSLGTTPDPCDDTVYDPNSQFFGTLDPKTYFNAAGGLVCASNQVDYAIAAGIDHNLSTFEPDFVVGVAHPDELQEECNPTPISGANTMLLKTGLTAQLLRCGLLTTNGGTCGSSVPGAAGNVPARLHLGPYVSSTHTFLNESMDNKPLWDFLVDPSSLTAPSECLTLYTNLSNPAWDYFDKKDELRDCMTSWNRSTDDPIFSGTIQTTPRFAWIPLLAESNLNTEPAACPSTGGTCVHFNEFVPIYHQTLYSVFTGNQPRGACDMVGGPGQRWGRHDAGETNGNCGRSNDNLDRLSGFVIECGMLPGDVCASRPGSPGGMPIPEIELTK